MLRRFGEKARPKPSSLAHQKEGILPSTLFLAAAKPRADWCLLVFFTSKKMTGGGRWDNRDPAKSASEATASRWSTGTEPHVGRPAATGDWPAGPCLQSPAKIDSFSILIPFFRVPRPRNMVGRRRVASVGER